MISCVRLDRCRCRSRPLCYLPCMRIQSNPLLACPFCLVFPVLFFFFFFPFLFLSIWVRHLPTHSLSGHECLSALPNFLSKTSESKRGGSVGVTTFVFDGVVRRFFFDDGGEAEASLLLLLSSSELSSVLSSELSSDGESEEDDESEDEETSVRDFRLRLRFGSGLLLLLLLVRWISRVVTCPPSIL